VCEEFACVPSAAWRELQRLPCGLLDEILEARHYARAKALVDAADTADAYRSLPPSELMTLAKTITFERAADGRRRRHG